MTRLFAALAGLTIVLACGGGGAPPKCEAFVEFGGKPYQGAGKDVAAATDNACYHYCAVGDPEFQAFFGVFVNSPEGSKYKGRDPLDVVLDSNASLKPHHEACVTRCSGDAPAGKNGLAIRNDCP